MVVNELGFLGSRTVLEPEAFTIERDGGQIGQLKSHTGPTSRGALVQMI